MLLKVFKHDFKTAARYEVPILLALLGATLLGVVDILIFGASMRAGYDSESIIAGLGVILGGIGWMFVYFAIIAASSVMAFVIYWRFYKSMVTDEAYLTLTLPVKPKTLITGKLLSSVLWMTIASVACILAFTVVFGGMFALESPEIYIPTFEDWATLGFTPWTAVIVAASTVIMMFSGTLQVFFAILFASSIVKKYKALCAVGVVIGVNMIVSTISSVVAIIASIFGIGFSADTVSESELIGVMYNVMFGSMGVVSLLLGVLFFWLCCYLVKNKVNLE